MADSFRLTCTCGRWVGYTDGAADAQKLAESHREGEEHPLEGYFGSFSVTRLHSMTARSPLFS